MAIENDFSVSADGAIRYTNADGENYTVIELHRYLQDLADNASSAGDDILDITDSTPSDRSTDNIITLFPPYNIDDAAAEHLYDGSITQDDGDTVYSGLVVLGTVNSPDTELQIVQNNELVSPAYWGTGVNNEGQNLLRIMVKTRENGVTIDGGRVRVQSRELGDTYAEFTAALGQGNSVAAISTQPDLNNQTDAATIASWTSIGSVEGLAELDINGNGTAEQYYLELDRGQQSINDLYEFAKYIQSRGGPETIFGLPGELFRGITDTVVVSNAGVFETAEVVTFSNGATAVVLASSSDELHVQLLTGVAPATGDTVEGGTSGSTADVDSVVGRTVSSSFIGSSTGSAIIGGFGVGIQPADLTASDLLFDLTASPQNPPNFVVFTVGGLVAGEDYVLVGPDNGGTFDEEQLSANGAHSATDVEFVVNEVIPTDTPSSGSIRVFNDVTFVRVAYSSYSGSTFVLEDTLGADVAADANAYVSYLDQVATSVNERFTSVFDSTRSLFIRVRDGGDSPIRTFETTGSLSSGGGSTTTIRTADI